ncbi:TonB-dependent receptor [Nitratiruptor sp. SB155-2]|uniref:TonB-dependent receptor n=1 Tax=Nitratiruptor sp. (strain SB155-2) TaxID=387092 RepID=UPI00015871CE|nr:TonB-dependent receptor [Nitratiruptor sp. SB155-2]BAF70061.1 TonB-dependent receptor [Nitratiruptor sp. SB155-2]
MRKSLFFSVIASCAIAGSMEIEQISVTATGLEEENFKLPLSIESKGEKEIDLDQVVYQKELLNSISGVRIEQTGSVLGHMTGIRMPLNTGPYYLFMQDGIPVQSSGFFNHNGLAYTTFQNANSVEVLKGAGTALYGSDAVAAVINVRSLDFDKKESEIKAEGGSYGYATLRAKTAKEIQGTDFAAKANIMHSDGWRDHTDTNHGELDIGAKWQKDDENFFKLMFHASKTDALQADSFNDYDNITSRSEAASDDPNYFKALSLTDVSRKFDFARISLEWDNYSFKNLEIQNIAYLRYNRNRYTATWEKNLPKNDNKLYTFGLRNKNFYEDSNQKMVFGIDAEVTHSTLDYIQPFTITTTGWGATTYYAGPLYDYDVDYFAIAPFIQYERKLTSALSLHAGLRYDYNRFDYNNNLEDDSYDASGTYFRPADRTDNFSHLSPKLAFSYINGANNFYVRYANGFRIPQASRLYSMKKGYEFVSLDPETSDTYEIGWKRETGNLFTSIALYYMVIDNTITRYEENGVRYYANGNDTIHKGIELTCNYAIDIHNKIHIAYSYSRHNYHNDPKYGDNEMAQAPNHLANFRYTFKYDKLSLMPEMNYVGRYWMDDAHTYSYSGYTLWHLKGSYDMTKNAKLYFKINNVIDKHYAAYARYAYGKTDYTPGDPRMIYVGFSYRW